MPSQPFADRFLQEYGITHPSEIDLEAIAYDKGAYVRYRLLDGCEARIVGKGNQAIISIDPRPIPTRKRFSLAHELAHWLLDRGSIGFLCKQSDIGARGAVGNSAEAAANALAAQLLMPGYLFKPLSRKKPLTFDTVSELSKLFRTSNTTTVLRLVEIGDYPGMVVCFGPNGRQWFHRGQDVPEEFWPIRDLDEDSQAFELLYGGDHATRPKKIGAEAWIDRRDAHQYTLTEHSIMIADDVVLTLLWWQDEKQIRDFNS